MRHKQDQVQQIAVIATQSATHERQESPIAISTASTQITARFYKPELDSLRFFAFLAVFIHHTFSRDAAFYTSRGFTEIASAISVGVVYAGGFGVDIFFLLSSYLITSLLSREHGATGTIDVPSFYARRCLRIWPLYFFAIALIGIAAPNITALVPPLQDGQILGLLSFTSNWTVALNGFGANPIDVLWSVALEEQFYLILPLILWCTGINRLPVLSAFALGVFVLGRIALTLYDSALEDALLTVYRWEPMALGALLAVTRLPPRTQWARIALCLAGVAIPVACCVCALPTMIALPGVAAGSALVLAGIIDSRSIWVTNRVFVYLGKISYGLYVYHMFASRLTTRIEPDIPLGGTIVTLALTIALAVASYHGLEKPFLRLKDRFAHVQSRPV